MSKSEAKKLVESTIKENKVAVFSKGYCPYCTMAKEALDKVCGKDGYLVVEIDKLPNCSVIQDVLKEMTGARSVPRVFINETCIGGGTETKDLHASGELEKMINS